MNPLDLLKQQFLDEYKSNPAVKKYVGDRLDESGAYTGWVGPTKISDHPTLTLHLESENDQFLLFCLASAWSATGPWENAATLIYTIKYHCPTYANPNSWIGEVAFENTKAHVSQEFECHRDVFSPRKSSVIRKDIFPAFGRIANKWSDIQFLLKSAAETSSWERFIHELRDIKGLAPGSSGEKKLLIKIPLILRELRCQNIFENIPGELCCVPDARVIDVIKIFQKDPDFDLTCGLKAYRPSDANSLISSSKAIYRIFGDLYDLPLFAAEDINPALKRQHNQVMLP